MSEKAEEAKKVKIELDPRVAAMLVKHLQHEATVLGQVEGLEYITLRELIDLIDDVEKQLNQQGVTT